MWKGNNLILSLLLGLFLGVWWTGPLGAQTPAGNTGVAPSAQKALKKVIVQGKIKNLKSMGGYYILGRGEVYKIANKNPLVLEELTQSGKIVTIEAGSQGDILTIEKIDGEIYPGSKPPGAK
jgi:hypothetical protein